MSTLPESLRKEIGQHFVFGFHGYHVNADVVKLIQEYHVGAIILFRRNVKDIQQVHDLVQSLQKLAFEAGHTQPLLIGIDQENGLVSAFTSTTDSRAGTQFPGAMALGTSGSPSLAAETTRASAREMKMVGINWVFSPVADINSDPRNPVIGVRSFGEDANVVAEFAVSVASALEKEGIASCAKHFPGHGDTHIDSHLDLPVITKTLESLRETELVPFSALSFAPIASIMTAHISLPSLHPDSSTTSVPPASLSREVSNKLIRLPPPTGIGFSGVVVTDCLEMNAISEGIGIGQGSVEALKAGADIVMVCHRIDRQVSALEATYAAVENGIINMDELKKSAARISTLKSSFADTWAEVLSHSFDSRAFEDLKAENIVLSKRAYKQTARWLRRPLTEGLLPKDKSLLILTPEMEKINPAVDDPEIGEGVSLTEDGKIRNTAGPSYLSFARAIKARAPLSSHSVYQPSDTILSEALLDSIRSADSLIFTTRNAHQSSSAWQMSVLKGVLKVIRGEKLDITVYVLVSCAPYDFSALETDDETKGLPVLCTYEFTKEALEAAADILFET